MFRKKINSTYGIIKAAVSLLLVISLTGCSLSGGDKKEVIMSGKNAQRR